MSSTRQLGKTNIEVCSIGLGAMPLSLQGRPDETQAIEVIESFINTGGNFIDTANVYCLNESDMGHNEKVVEKALSTLSYKNDVIVATKGGIDRDGDNWIANGKPAFLRQSCENSLLALKSDTIFLYQLHAPDPEVPLTDSVAELLKLKDEGKIQYIGLSNVSVEQIQLALSITDILSVQNRCNLFDQRSFNNGVVEFCEQNNISFIAHSPVGGHFQHTQLTNNPLLISLSKKYNASPYQIMLSWLLRKSTSILPIPGASKVRSIEDSMKALHLVIDNEDIQELNKL